MLSTPDQLDRLSRRSDGLARTVVPLAKKHRGVCQQYTLFSDSARPRSGGKVCPQTPRRITPTDGAMEEGGQRVLCEASAS